MCSPVRSDRREWQSDPSDILQKSLILGNGPIEVVLLDAI